ncbi:MAG: DUF367 domain-containing protein [Candidatus Thermoplasmatota archaeon]|nr:DUF367 domain-containing protein [Candidatus Thermoplasmatota archaeon]
MNKSSRQRNRYYSMHDLQVLVRVVYHDFALDDPSKSTMRKLHRFGLADPVPISARTRIPNLNPYSEIILLPIHREKISRKGLMVLETSWNRISQLKDLVTAFSFKLPTLLPVNPVNYGKPGILSSVEALASALYITGYRDDAAAVLSKFSWAQTFLGTNREPLEVYSKCETQEAMHQAIGEFF